MIDKFHIDLLPCLFSQLHVHVKYDSIHYHNTRRSDLLVVPLGFKSFTNVIDLIWNILSNIIDLDVLVPISKFMFH